MRKISKNWKKRLIKSYSSLSILANILTALSISGLSVLGVVSNYMTIPLLVGLSIFFGIVGLFGRIVDQGIDDLQKEIEHDKNS